MNNFIEKYPLKKLIPADYNPRKISQNSFQILKYSLKKFGLIKPVIANKNGIIVAGHQRTKAMKAIGITECPIFLLDKQVSVADEIKFNLMHNSIETNTSKIRINQETKEGFNLIKNENIELIQKGKGIYIKEICKLLSKYEDFDSCIIDENGEIIENSDYVLSCKLLGKNLIAYKLIEDSKEFKEILKTDFGNYSYEALNIKPYVQTHCQMSRNNEKIGSTLYKEYVIPNIKKSDSILDFGAGKMLYVNLLHKQGYNVLGYEPYYKLKGTEKLNISEVINQINKIKMQIKSKGLFDVVVLDSVLNSITSNNYEKYVLTVCNACLKRNGVCYIGTRNKNFILGMQNNKKATDDTRLIEFLDNDNYSATFRKGVWTLQKFHTKETLNKLLKKFFKEVEISGEKGSQLYAICKKPIKIEKKEIKKALEEEFNIVYPNNFRHNKHKELIETILKAQEEVR